MEPHVLADPAFQACLMQAAANDELLSQFDRLAGTNLTRQGSPINLAIDAATGRHEDDVRRFIEFVADCIYSRLEPSVLASMRQPLN